MVSELRTGEAEVNISQPGWADAYGKAMADKDEAAKCEATGLTPRRNFPINRERYAESAARGAKLGAITKRQKRAAKK